MPSIRATLALFLVVPMLAACGVRDSANELRDRASAIQAEAQRLSESSENDDGEGPDFGRAMEGMAAALGGRTDGARFDPVDFRTLRELLPEQVVGMDRSNLSGESQAMAGFSVSQAEAQYTGENRESLTIKVVDGTNYIGMLTAAWRMSRMDRESDTGFERTTEFEGHPAYEKLQNDRGELQLVVADRFHVTANSRGLEMDQVRQAVRSLDLRALERMRDENRRDPS